MAARAPRYRAECGARIMRVGLRSAPPQRAAASSAHYQRRCARLQKNRTSSSAAFVCWTPGAPHIYLSLLAAVSGCCCRRSAAAEWVHRFGAAGAEKRVMGLCAPADLAAAVAALRCHLALALAYITAPFLISGTLWDTRVAASHLGLRLLVSATCSRDLIKHILFPALYGPLFMGLAQRTRLQRAPATRAYACCCSMPLFSVHACILPRASC